MGSVVAHASAALALLAAQAAAAGDPGPLAGLGPASAVAVRAGVTACIGSTVDPAGQDSRLAGWVDATPAQKQAVHGEGRVVRRDNVLVVVKPGLTGGCVVMARLAPDFDAPTFYADLSKDLGVTLVTDAKSPVTELGQGEVLVTTMTGAPDNPMAVLVVGNTRGQAMKHKGN